MSSTTANDLRDTCQLVSDGLNSFHNAVLHLASQAQNCSPAPSQMAQELASCPAPENLQEAYWYAQRAAFQIAVDHIDAISRELTPPILTYSPWLSARCVLEQCSLAYWLSDTDIDFEDRLCRILNIRLRSVRDSKTWMRLAKNSAGESSTEEVKRLNDRIGHMRQVAMESGVSEKCSKKGELLGFGNGLPSWTSLARVAFDAEESYRFLSGTAHGEFWTSSLSTKVAEGDFEYAGRRLSPSIEAHSALWIGVYVTEWFAKTSWEIFSLAGWDMKALAATLEDAYNNMAINPETRFWRKDYLTMVRP